MRRGAVPNKMSNHRIRFARFASTHAIPLTGVILVGFLGGQADAGPARPVPRAAAAPHVSVPHVSVPHVSAAHIAAPAANHMAIARPPAVPRMAVVQRPAAAQHVAPARLSPAPRTASIRRGSAHIATRPEMGAPHPRPGHDVDHGMSRAVTPPVDRGGRITNAHAAIIPDESPRRPDIGAPNHPRDMSAPSSDAVRRGLNSDAVAGALRERGCGHRGVEPAARRPRPAAAPRGLVAAPRWRLWMGRPIVLAVRL